VPYNINVSYSNLKRGWVIVVFPTSLRIEFGIVRNLNYVSVDREAVWSAIAAAIIALLLFISLSVFLLSKFTSYQFIRPLKTLKSAVSQIKEGHYDHRVEMSASKEFTDVAELFNQMAAQVESKQQKLISSEQHRQQLILDISHDLRNPLSVILGCSSLLKSPELTSEQSFKYASMIENHGLRAKDLIDQLFDLSRLQSVDFRLSLTEVEVFEWLRKRIATQIGVFEQGGYDYQVLISEERLIKSVDVFWLERVIFNLLDNTMRHNHPPLTIMIESYQDENAWVICISDDGIGVDPEMLEGIFDRYVSPSGGSGLGLAIAKKAVEAHGGSIRCINRENKGCTFEIRLP
jgi:signal transduction histidine kinase